MDDRTIIFAALTRALRRGALGQLEYHQACAAMRALADERDGYRAIVRRANHGHDFAEATS